MNILKVVIDGGWVIQKEEFEEIMSMIQIVSDGRDKQQVFEFFSKAAKEFEYDL